MSKLKGRQGMYKVIVALFCVIVLFNIWMEPVHATIKSPDDFEDANWELLTSIELESNPPIWGQGSCNTENYIVLALNTNDADASPDTIMALYKNPYDENGKPVEQYSIAKQVTERDYEHANGMAYNPNTKEIAITGYVSKDPNNKASVFIIDSETLEYKRTVKLENPGSDLLGIDYMPEKNQYMIQASGDGKNIFFVTDGEFNYSYTLDESLPSNTIGCNFQDFCVSGDYIITTPLMMGISEQQYLEIFSISQNRFYNRYKLNLPLEATFIEPESICELSPGRIMVMVPSDNPRRINLFATTLPAVCTVTTTVENGTILPSNTSIDYGSNYTVTYEPQENMGLLKLTVDGKEIDVSKFQKEYTFESIEKNHHVEVKFADLPKYSISTKVKKGAIDNGTTIMQGQSATVSYRPSKNYKVSKIIIDGKKIKTTNHKNEYTFKDIQKSHSIQVVYTWKYNIVVWSVVAFLCTLFACYYRALVIRRRRSRRRRAQRRQEEVQHFRDAMREVYGKV